MSTPEPLQFIEADLEHLPPPPLQKILFPYRSVSIDTWKKLISDIRSKPELNSQRKIITDVSNLIIASLSLNSFYEKYSVSLQLDAHSLLREVKQGPQATTADTDIEIRTNFSNLQMDLQRNILHISLTQSTTEKAEFLQACDQYLIAREKLATSLPEHLYAQIPTLYNLCPAAFEYGYRILPTPLSFSAALKAIVKRDFSPETEEIIYALSNYNNAREQLMSPIKPAIFPELLESEELKNLNYFRSLLLFILYINKYQILYRSSPGNTMDITNFPRWPIYERYRQKALDELQLHLARPEILPLEQISTYTSESFPKSVRHFFNEFVYALEHSIKMFCPIDKLSAIKYRPFFIKKGSISELHATLEQIMAQSRYAKAFAKRRHRSAVMPANDIDTINFYTPGFLEYYLLSIAPNANSFISGLNLGSWLTNKVFLLHTWKPEGQVAPDKHLIFATACTLYNQALGDLLQDFIKFCLTLLKINYTLDIRTNTKNPQREHQALQTAVLLKWEFSKKHSELQQSLQSAIDLSDLRSGHLRARFKDKYQRLMDIKDYLAPLESKLINAYFDFSDQPSFCLKDAAQINESFFSLCVGVLIGTANFSVENFKLFEQNVYSYEKVLLYREENLSVFTKDMPVPAFVGELEIKEEVYASHAALMKSLHQLIKAATIMRQAQSINHYTTYRTAYMVYQSTYRDIERIAPSLLEREAPLPIAKIPSPQTFYRLFPCQPRLTALSTSLDSVGSAEELFAKKQPFFKIKTLIPDFEKWKVQRNKNIIFTHWRSSGIKAIDAVIRDYQTINSFDLDLRFTKLLQMQEIINYRYLYKRKHLDFTGQDFWNTKKYKRASAVKQLLSVIQNELVAVSKILDYENNNTSLLTAFNYLTHNSGHKSFLPLEKQWDHLLRCIPAQEVKIELLELSQCINRYTQCVQAKQDVNMRLEILTLLTENVHKCKATIASLPNSLLKFLTELQMQINFEITTLEYGRSIASTNSDEALKALVI